MKKIFNWLLAKKWWVVAVIVVLAIVGVVIWRNSQKNKETFTTVNPTRQIIRETLDVTGGIDADEKADLHFLTANRLSWMGVKEGDQVKQWQALASVDTRTTQKQLQQALNNFGKEFRDHDQDLQDSNYYNNPDIDNELRRFLDKSQLDLNNSVLTVEIQDLAIKLSSIISPVNGIVTRIDKPFAGANVTPADMIQVVNPKTLFFGAVVDEVDIAKIQPDQVVSIKLDAYPDAPIDSTVSRIEFTPSTSRSGGTGYRVHIPINEESPLLKYKLGMNGTAQVLLAQKDNVLTIPVDALIVRDGQTYVEVLVNGNKERRDIETGIETDTQVEVVSGLSESDVVVLPQSAQG